MTTTASYEMPGGLLEMMTNFILYITGWLGRSDKKLNYYSYTLEKALFCSLEVHVCAKSL